MTKTTVQFETGKRGENSAARSLKQAENDAEGAVTTFDHPPSPDFLEMG